MAQGTVEFFDSFLLELCTPDDNSGNKGHNFGTTPASDDIYCMLVDDTTTPTTATALPHYGGTGTVDWADWEVTDLGNYVNGGNICTTSSPTCTNNAGTIEFVFGNPAPWTSHASNGTARWGILYNSANTHKTCIGYVDLGAPFDMTAGTLTITWGTPVATIDQAV